MRLIRVAAAVLNQTPLDWEGNKRRIIAALRHAEADGASICCLPEMAITGYGCEDQFASPGLQETAGEILQEIAGECPHMIFSVGLPVLYRHALFNCVALVADGMVRGVVAKQHLAGDGIHYEPRWFHEWPAGQRGFVDIGNLRCPIGDLVFDFNGVRIGFEICEDAWVADRPGIALSKRGVDIILNPSASHFAFGKSETRKRFVLEGSRAFGVTYVYANLLGNEAGRAIYDGGALIASGGRLVAEGPRFSYREFVVTSATVDIDATRIVQSRTPSFRPDISDLDTNNSEVSLSGWGWESIQPAPPSGSGQDVWGTGSFVKEEEFTRAISLGLADYLRKSGSRGFVVSLSGGADSSACSVLVSTMVHLCHAELGAEECSTRLVPDRLGPDFPASSAPRDIIGRILTCVYQPTRNSSETTLTAARAVAEDIGARFLVLDVNDIAHAYTDLVEKALDRTLTWTHDDVALQNIQARVRAPSVWMIANLQGALLLATSNRSEAAVGYCTMDGDTAGSISPIAGIDKHFLRHWLHWIEAHTGSGYSHIPDYPSLELVNQQAPTAELRPPSAGQTDEADLMPYDILDAIEKAAIRDKKTPVDVYRTLRMDFPARTPEDLVTWVTRFFRLWARNQWKRERYAPSFHVDDENLDPRSWCRFPILSGGFHRELEQLKAHVTKEHP